MVSVEKVQMGMARYIDEELLPQLQSGSALKSFGINTAAALIISRGGGILAGLAANPIIAAMNVITPEGIDIEAVKEAADAAFPTTGLAIDIPFIGKKLTFQKDDLEKLYSMIAEG